MNDKLMAFRLHTASALKQTNSIQEFEQTISECVQALGFSDFDYERLTSAYGNVEFLMGTIPDGLVASYENERLYEHDMLLDYVINHSKPVFQSSIDQDLASSQFSYERNKQNARIYQLLADYQYNDCFSIPLQLKADQGKSVFAVLCKGAPALEFKRKVNQNLYELKTLAYTVQAVGSYKFPKSFPAGRRKEGLVLTEMQTKVLVAFARFDKSSHKVGERLGISHKTVEKHMSEAKKVLGAFSNVNAVYLAIEKGLIPLRGDIV